MGETGEKSDNFPPPQGCGTSGDFRERESPLWSLRGYPEDLRRAHPEHPGRVVHHDDALRGELEEPTPQGEDLLLASHHITRSPCSSAHASLLSDPQTKNIEKLPTPQPTLSQSSPSRRRAPPSLDRRPSPGYAPCGAGANFACPGFGRA